MSTTAIATASTTPEKACQLSIMFIPSDATKVTKRLVARDYGLCHDILLLGIKPMSVVMPSNSLPELTAWATEESSCLP